MKNIIICCDGTNNQFGSNNTNVVRLVHVLNRNPNEQSIYYDPGVGTFPEPGFVSRMGKGLSDLMGLAFGLGLTRKIGEAYMFLMDHYEAGDRIYLFGFSRGAYTARALAGVLFQFGLLPAGSYNLVPYLLRLSKAINKLSEFKSEEGRKYWAITRDFRATFARISPENAANVHYVQLRFMGLWDTVSSVGWIWDPTHFPYTANNPCIEITRHAVAIDERRWFFRQNLWHQPNALSKQDVKEWWFPGVHSDVGGGYAEAEGGLWRAPFIWMVLEAHKAGLKIDSRKVREVLKKTPITPPCWANAKHESLRWRWWLAEFLPKFSKWKGPGLHWPRIGLFRCRTIRDGALLHRSALLRLRRAPLAYRPKNLSADFQAFVKALPKVPVTMPYRASRTSASQQSKLGC